MLRIYLNVSVTLDLKFYKSFDRIRVTIIMMVKAHENCMSFWRTVFESFGFFVLYQMCKGGVKVQDFRSRTENQIFGVRATALIIQNNQIYLNRNENNQYYTIGGAICVNELSEDAVRREVMEEVGLSVEVERLAFVV